MAEKLVVEAEAVPIWHHCEVSGSKDYMDMWVTFRGREPEIEPSLRNLGLQ